MVDINQYAPRSGRLIKEDNTIVNEANGINADGSRNVQLTGSKDRYAVYDVITQDTVLAAGATIAIGEGGSITTGQPAINSENIRSYSVTGSLAASGSISITEHLCSTINGGWVGEPKTLLAAASREYIRVARTVVDGKEFQITLRNEDATDVTIRRLRIILWRS